MTRKPPPERVYRVEHYDDDGTYLNSTYQYLNKPAWWPGVSTVHDDLLGMTKVFCEGTITWERP